MMKLDKILEAITDAYKEGGFERVLRLKLDRRLDAYSSGGDFRTSVYETVDAADREGWLGDLVGVIKLDRPGNAYINALPIIDSAAPLDVQGVEVEVSSHDQLEAIKIQLAHMDEKVEYMDKKLSKLGNLLIGEYGDNGISSVSRRNERKLSTIDLKVNAMVLVFVMTLGYVAFTLAI